MNFIQSRSVIILTPPFSPRGKAAYRQKDSHELRRRSFPSQCLTIICSRPLIIAQHGLSPLTVYREIKVVHQAAFLGTDKLIYSTVRVGGGADPDARLCQSVA